MTVHVIVNRRARRLDANGALLRAIRGFAGRATLHETRSLEELERAARAIAAAGARAVILAGGDGSYTAGVTALRGAFQGDLPPIGLAGGGTVSTVARNVGLRGDGAKYTERLIDAAIRGAARERAHPTLHVADAKGASRTGFIFGTGLVAQFFDVYDAAPRQGYAEAGRIVARIFAGSFTGGALARRILTPMPCTLDVDGARAPATAYSLIVSSVVRDLGLHMHVVHRAGEDPHRVHLVASPLGARGLGPQLPLVLAGRRLLGRDHVDTLAATFRVTFTGDVAKYVLDGDAHAAPWVDVSAGPVLRLLTP